MGRVFGTMEVIAPVGELVDVDAVRRDVEAKLAEATSALARTEQKLSNANYVERADPAVVAETRQRAAELSSQIATLRQHLSESD
jgi:valyl-tRNA synthetase